MTKLLILTSLLVPLATSPLVNAASCLLTGSSIDDVSTVKSSCTQIIIEDLTVPGGQLLDLTGLQKGTTVRFRGTTTFGYYEWEGQMMNIGGTNIRVIGESGHVINGQGELYWDGLGGGGITKPKFIKLTKMIDSTVEGLYILNSPKNVFSVTGCQNLTVTGVTVDDKEGDKTNGGHNTDAFDVGNSDRVTIRDSYIYNQDDCLAVNSGTNIYFINNYCSGGHGISIGSIGGRDNNVVENVSVEDCTIIDSDNGVRIKTIYNTTGSITGVTYKNIVLRDIKLFGITLRGDYPDNKGVASNGIPIKGLTISNVTGTVKSGGTNVYILLGSGVASDWVWEDVNITGGTVKRTCTGIPIDCGASCS